MKVDVAVWLGDIDGHDRLVELGDSGVNCLLENVVLVTLHLLQTRYNIT